MIQPLPMVSLYGGQAGQFDPSLRGLGMAFFCTFDHHFLLAALLYNGGFLQLEAIVRGTIA
jgi:hypothetical protein